MRIINVHAISIDGAIASSPIESDAQRMEYGLPVRQIRNMLENLEESDAVITGSSSLISAGDARK